MAGVRWKTSRSAVSLSAATKKTAVQVKAADHHALLISEVEVSFNGTTSTNEPVLIEIARQSDAGTGGTSLTVVKDPDDSAETLQVTALHSPSSEPTQTDVLRRIYVHPQSGWSWQAPYKGEIKVGGGDRIAVAITAPDAVSATVSIVGEE